MTLCILEYLQRQYYYLFFSFSPISPHFRQIYFAICIGILQFLEHKRREDSGNQGSLQETGQREREGWVGGSRGNHPSGNENQIVTKASENKLP